MAKALEERIDDLETSVETLDQNLRCINNELESLRKYLTALEGRVFNKEVTDGSI